MLDRRRLVLGACAALLVGFPQKASAVLPFLVRGGLMLLRGGRVLRVASRGSRAFSRGVRVPRSPRTSVSGRGRTSGSQGRTSESARETAREVNRARLSPGDVLDVVSALSDGLEAYGETLTPADRHQLAVNATRYLSSPPEEDQLRHVLEEAHSRPFDDTFAYRAHVADCGPCGRCYEALFQGTTIAQVPAVVEDNIEVRAGREAENRPGRKAKEVPLIW